MAVEKSMPCAKGASAAGVTRLVVSLVRWGGRLRMSNKMTTDRIRGNSANSCMAGRQPFDSMYASNGERVAMKPPRLVPVRMIPSANPLCL